jgi:hypothetical protein
MNILNPIEDPSWADYPQYQRVVSEHGNGNASNAIVIGGTFYKSDTPVAVVTVLEIALHTRQRLRIEYGYTKDDGPDKPAGRAWGAGGIEVCTIGRSMGPIRIPLAIKTSRSHGGASLLDNAIVRITDAKTGKVLYEHPHYSHTGEVIYFAPVTDWERIAARLSFDRLTEQVAHARTRGVQSCELWFSAEERKEIESLASVMGIVLKVRQPRF